LHLFKCIKNNDYNLFLREELSRRKSLHYPPYARLLLLRFASKNDLSSELSNIQKKFTEEVEFLGPSVSENKRGKYEFKLLLKSSIRGNLHSVARTFLSKYRESRDVAVKVDVDPISI
jgi:primosomal protein N' (replication factor Y)